MDVLGAVSIGMPLLTFLSFLLSLLALSDKTDTFLHLKDTLSRLSVSF